MNKIEMKSKTVLPIFFAAIVAFGQLAAVRGNSKAAVPGPGQAAGIKTGFEYDGRLEAGDRRFETGELLPGSWFDEWQVEVEEGKIYAIAVNCHRDFDPYLVVANEQSEILLQQGENALLQFKSDPRIGSFLDSQVAATADFQAPYTGLLRVYFTTSKPDQLPEYKVRVLDTGKRGPKAGEIHAEPQFREEFEDRIATLEVEVRVALQSVERYDQMVRDLTRELAETERPTQRIYIMSLIRSAQRSAAEQRRVARGKQAEIDRLATASSR